MRGADPGKSIISRKNSSILVVEISLHQGPIWRRLLKSFVAFARSRALKAGMSDSGENGDDRDYNKQLDQGECALEQGEGNFCHDIGG